MMGAARALRIEEMGSEPGVFEVTLWELVWAVSEVASSEAEVIATVAALLQSGKVRLTGNFRGSPILLG